MKARFTKSNPLSGYFHLARPIRSSRTLTKKWKKKKKKKKNQQQIFFILFFLAFR